MIKVPNNKRELLKWWNHFTNPAAVTSAPMAPVKGQGLGLTKWKGWLECVVIIYFSRIQCGKDCKDIRLDYCNSWF